MRKIPLAIAAAVAATSLLPATASAQPTVGRCEYLTGPVYYACVGVDPRDPSATVFLIVEGTKYRLTVNPRTGEVSFCKYTETGPDCYVG
jgi:hypothetical protein